MKGGRESKRQRTSLMKQWEIPKVMVGTVVVSLENSIKAPPILREVYAVSHKMAR